MAKTSGSGENGMKGKNDRELLALVAEGSPAAWEALVGRYGDFVYSLAHYILGGAAEAEDAVQETFLKVRTAARTFRFGDDAKGWIAKIAHREVINVLRMRRGHSGNVSLDEAASGLEIRARGSEMEAENAETLAILRNSLGTLPEGVRSVIALHFAAGLTQAEIAKELNCGQATVSERIKDGLALLKKKLAAAGVTDAFALTPAALMTSLISEEAPKVVLAKALKLGIVKLSSIKMTAVPLVAKKAAVASLISAKAAVVAAVAAVAIGGAALIATKEQPKPVVPSPSPVQPAPVQVEGKLVVFEQDRKWGFKDAKGNVVLEPQFDQFRVISEGLAILRKDGKWGCIDVATGKTAIPFQFGKIYNFNEGLAGALSMKIGKYGFIDKSGAFVIEPKYAYLHDFTDGMAGVAFIEKASKGSKFIWGFVDNKGNMVIEPKFDNVASFIQGKAHATLNDKAVIIDKNGNIIPENDKK